MSSLSSESSTSSSSPRLNDDDVELARGETNTGLQSGDEEEILCNYGDKLLLSDDVSEDVEDGGGEMSELIGLIPTKPKPTPPVFLTSMVRFFVGGRVVDKEVVSNLFEKNKGKEEEENTEEFSEEYSGEYGKC